MRHVLLALFLAAPAMVSAQTTPYEPPRADGHEQLPDQENDGLGSLFERGAESLLRDLFSDIEPHMNAIGDKLGGRLQSLAPVFDDLGKLMDDLDNYQPPERLANGDILIRRKPDAPPPPPVGNNLLDLVDPPEEAPLADPPALGGEIEL